MTTNLSEFNSIIKDVTNIDQTFTLQNPTSNRIGYFNYSSSDPTVAEIISSYTQIGPNILGLEENKRLGMSVCFSADGLNFAVCSNTNNGSVFVYNLDYSEGSYNWTIKGGEITPTDLNKGGFGGSISLSGDGNTIAIGGEASQSNTGTVTLYKYDGSIWNMVGSVITNPTARTNYFGTSISLSSDVTRLIVGQRGYHTFGTSNIFHLGAVYVYDIDSEYNFTLTNTFVGSNENDSFGYGVELTPDGNTLVAGTNPSSAKGYVRVYNYSNSTWTQKGSTINSQSSSSDDRYGRCVSVSADGNIIAIGSPGYNSNTGCIQIYTFDSENSDWIQKGSNITGSQLAQSIKLSSNGNTIICGTGETNKVELYKFIDGSWQLVKSFTALSHSNFGGSVNLLSLNNENNLVIIGSIMYSSDSISARGAVQVYYDTQSLKILKAGISTITAKQFASNNYSQGLISSTLTVNKLDPIITFNSVNKIYGNSDFSPIITSNSSGQFTYTSSNLSVATIVNNQIHITGAGTTTITATQATDPIYNSKSVGSVLTVNRAETTLTSNNISKVYGDQNFNYNGTSNRIGYFNYSSSDPTVAEIISSYKQIGNTISGSVNSEALGDCVKFSSDGLTFAVSSTRANNNEGLVKVYSLNYLNGEYLWVQKGGDILPNIRESNLYFGGSISLNADGNTIIVGSEADNEYKGSITLYNFNGTQWIMKSYLTQSDLSFVAFGNSVSLNSNATKIAVGCKQYTKYERLVNKGTYGAISIYRIVNFEFVLEQLIVGSFKEGFLGWSVEINGEGNVLIAGGFVSNGNGYAQIYKFNSINNSWNQLGQTIPSQSLASLDWYGNCVSISLDGNTVAINCPFYYSNTGVIEIYTYDNVLLQWIPKGASISGLSVAKALKLSADGNTVISGSEFDKVKIFKYSNENWELTNTIIPENYGAFGTSVDLISFDNQINLILVGANATSLNNYSRNGSAYVYYKTSNTIKINSTGTTSIITKQYQTNNYNEGEVTAELTVEKADPTISFNNINKIWGQMDFVPNIVSNSSGQFTYVSSNPLVATIVDNQIHITGIGSTTITVTQASTNNYNSRVATAELTVVKAYPIINFNNINKIYGNSDFVPAITSNSSGQFTFTSSNLEVATIVDNQIHIIGVGSTTITATQASTDNYNSKEATSKLIVVKADPTISFNNLNKIWGQIDFVPDITSNSSGQFTYVSSNPLVAIIVDNQIHITGTGLTSITVTQASTNNYNSGEETAELTVEKADPIISFNNINKIYGNSDFIPDISSNSSGEFTFISSNLSVATINNQTNKFHIEGVGTSIITAFQEADNYYNSKEITIELVVGKANPVIIFNDVVKSYGDSAFIPVVTSNSSGLFTFNSSNQLVAEINRESNQIEILGVGETEITVFQASDNNYNSGVTTAILTVNKANPIVGLLLIPNKSVKDNNFIIENPTKPNDHDGLWSYESLNLDKATVEDKTITFLKGGIVKILATLSGTSLYFEKIIQAQFSISESEEPSNFEFINSDLVDNAIPNDIEPEEGVVIIPVDIFSEEQIQKFNPNEGTNDEKSANRSLFAESLFNKFVDATEIVVPKEIIYLPPELIIEEISEVKLINASQSTTDNPLTYELDKIDKTQAIYSLLDNPGNTIEFNGINEYSGFSIKIIKQEDINYTIIKKNDKGEINEYTAFKGNLVYYLGLKLILGSVTGQLFVPEPIVFDPFIIPVKKYGDDPFIINVTSNSTGLIEYTSSNHEIATISGNIVTIHDLGTVTITATQEPDNNYDSGSISTTLTINKANPTIIFPNIEKTFGDDPFIIEEPESNSSGDFSFMIDPSSDQTVATIENNEVTIIGAGQTKIILTQKEDEHYNSLIKFASLKVNKADPIINVDDINKTYGDFNFVSKVTSNSSGLFNFTSLDLSVAKIINLNEIEIVGAGETIITVKQNSDKNYNEGEEMLTLTVDKAIPTISLDDTVKFYDDSNFIPEVKTNSTGNLIFSITDSEIASVTESNQIFIIKVGTTKVTAYQESDNNYYPGSAIAQLTINKADPNLYLEPINKKYNDEDFEINALTNSSGELTYSIYSIEDESKDSEVAEIIDGNIVHITGVGQAIITINQEESENYNKGSIITILTVKGPEQFLYTENTSSMRILTIENKGIISGDPKKDFLPNSFLKYHSKNITEDYDKTDDNKRSYIKEDSDHYIFQYNIKEQVKGRYFDWSSDGKYLVSYFGDSNIVYIYDVGTVGHTGKVKLLRTIYLDYGNPKMIKYSPDSKKLGILYATSPESDNEPYGQLDIYLIDNLMNNNLEPLKSIKPSDYPELQIELFLPTFDWSSNNTKIYLGSQTNIQNLINYNEKIKNIELEDQVGFVMIIDTRSYKVVNQIHQNYDLGELDSYFGLYIKTSPDGKKIAIGNYGQNLYIYKNNITKYLIDIYENLFENVSEDSFTWGPDSSKIAVGHYNDTTDENNNNKANYYVNVYDDLTKVKPVPVQTLKTDNLENNFGSTMSWSSDGKKLAVSLGIAFSGGQAGSWYGYTYIYDTSDFKNPLIITENNNSDYPTYLKYNSNGSVLGVSNYDNLFFYQTE